MGEQPPPGSASLWVKEGDIKPRTLHICVLSLHIVQLEKGKNPAQWHKQRVEQEWVENLRTQENGVANMMSHPAVTPSGSLAKQEIKVHHRLQ